MIYSFANLFEVSRVEFSRGHGGGSYEGASMTPWSSKIGG